MADKRSKKKKRGEEKEAKDKVILFFIHTEPHKLDPV